RRAAEPAADVEYPGLCGRRRETREPLRRSLATPVKVVSGCDVVDGESANILAVAGQGVEDGFAQPLAPPVLADCGGIRPADHGIHDVLLARSLKPSGLVSAFPRDVQGFPRDPGRVGRRPDPLRCPVTTATFPSSLPATLLMRGDLLGTVPLRWSAARRRIPSDMPERGTSHEA